MGDLVQFEIIKILNPDKMTEKEDDIYAMWDIFGDEIYFIEDWSCVGTEIPWNNGEYKNGTDWHLGEIGIDDVIENNFRDNIEFRKQLDEISSGYKNEFNLAYMTFSVLTEFEYGSGVDHGYDGDEWDYSCSFIKIIQ